MKKNMMLTDLLKKSIFNILDHVRFYCINELAIKIMHGWIATLACLRRAFVPYLMKNEALYKNLF